MKILLQTNNRSELQLEHEYKKLKESGFEIIPFGYIETKEVSFPALNSEDYSSRFKIPSPISLTGLEDVSPTTPVIARVSIPIIRRIYDLGIVRNVTTNFLSSIRYNPHRFSISTMPESKEFVNKTYGCFEFTILIQILDLVFSKDMFIKPDNDLKQFSGTLVPKGKTLRQVLTEKNEIVSALKHPVSTVLLSNNILEFEEEVRCYVVNNKVVTCSLYRKDNKTNMSPLSKEEQDKYMSYAQSIVSDVYSPSTEFTIDIAKTKEQGLKVIEYNCLNSSGLYECDTKALFTALKEYHYPEN